MASQESQSEAESNLNSQKNRSTKLWNKVEAAEKEARRRVAEMVRQRSRERELRRKKEESEKQAAFSDVNKLQSTVTTQEIWELGNYNVSKIFEISFYSSSSKSSSPISSSIPNVVC